MSLTVLALTHDTPISHINAGDPKGAALRLANALQAFGQGAQKASRLDVWTNTADARFASGTIAVSSASGTVGATINGVDVTFSHGASDQADSDTLVADINASTDALVQYLVQACNFACTVTLSSVAAGEEVIVCGYKFKAKAGGTLAADEFDQSGTDTADATSLKNQINSRLGLNRLVLASSSAGVVTVRQLSGTAAAGPMGVQGAGLTLSGQLAATTTVLISALHPGVPGNCITLAASGTGMAASGARLTGGAGAAASKTSLVL